MTARLGRDRLASITYLPAFLRAQAEVSIPGQALLDLSRVVIAVVVIGANVVGTAILLMLTLVVIPLPTTHTHPWEVTVAATVAYFAVAVPVGIYLGIPRHHGIREWLMGTAPCDDRVRRAILNLPLRVFAVQSLLWTVGCVGGGALEALGNRERGLWIAVIGVFTGVVSAAFSYLLTERLARPLALRALEGADPRRVGGRRGLALRTLVAWALGSGLPAAGVFALGVRSLFPAPDVTVHRLAAAVVVLTGVTLVFGLWAVQLAVRAAIDPIKSVVHGLTEVGAGNFDTHVAVYDGTEVGRLQAGFNDMVAGLAEREQIRAAFGTYVDPVVAEHILTRGTDLAGQEVEVSMMFIDIRNFTAFAERTAASDVVGTINRLFAKAVPIIRDNGGHVDKFVGDGLLAVFGAPLRSADHADQAVQAAREIAAAVDQEFGGTLSIGVGVNTGVVVAGNVGGAGRFEFSVIGDAVNVAARIESATRQTGDTILISDRTRALLTDTLDLIERPALTLKGKSAPVKLYAVPAS